MKRVYYKPQIDVVHISGRQQLLDNSKGSAMNMDMSGYSEGGNGEENNDGWSD